MDNFLIKSKIKLLITQIFQFILIIKYNFKKVVKINDLQNNNVLISKNFLKKKQKEIYTNDDNQRILI